MKCCSNCKYLTDYQKVSKDDVRATCLFFESEDINTLWIDCRTAEHCEHYSTIKRKYERISV